jgi:hypothetical protein
MKPYLMEAEVALNAVGCEEHFSLTCEYKQETVERLKHNRLHNSSIPWPHFKQINYYHGSTKINDDIA